MVFNRVVQDSLDTWLVMTQDRPINGLRGYGLWGILWGPFPMSPFFCASLVVSQCSKCSPPPAVEPLYRASWIRHANTTIKFRSDPTTVNLTGENTNYRRGHLCSWHVHCSAWEENCTFYEHDMGLFFWVAVRMRLQSGGAERKRGRWGWGLSQGFTKGRCRVK